MVEGTINGVPFLAALEPDGKGSHWFKVDQTLGEAGDSVKVAMEPTREWIEPEVPSDFKSALMALKEAYVTWEDITPMARWDWIRWINSTKQPETRKRRIEVACSKLKGGKRRPCCFNRNICTETSVSNNGVLLEPPQ